MTHLRFVHRLAVAVVVLIAGLGLSLELLIVVTLICLRVVVGVQLARLFGWRIKSPDT